MKIYENHIHSCTEYVKAYNHHLHVITSVEISRKKDKKKIVMIIISRLQMFFFFFKRKKKKRKDLLSGVRTGNHKKITQKLRQS